MLNIIAITQSLDFLQRQMERSYFNKWSILYEIHPMSKNQLSLCAENIIRKTGKKIPGEAVDYMVGNGYSIKKIKKLLDEVKDEEDYLEALKIR